MNTELIRPLVQATGDTRVRIAVQKSGRLTEHSLELLGRCGLTFSRGRDQLICFGENMPIDVLLVRDDDIPGLLVSGSCELGIVGANTWHEHALSRDDAGAGELQSLDFGRCRLSLAVPHDMAYTGPESLRDKTIATSYPQLLEKFLADAGVSARIVTLAGAVEIAPRLGRADLICDLVSSGATLAANHLREVQTIFSSQAVLVGRQAGLSDTQTLWFERLNQRIDGVQRVLESKYVMLHAPRAALPAIKKLLPGCESPTVLPLDGHDDRVAVHAVCKETVFWETLESLKRAGASALLVLPVEKMLA